MQRGRLIIVVAILLIVLSVGGIAVLFLMSGGLGTTTDPNASGGGNVPPAEIVRSTPTPIFMLGVSQDIQRGQIVPTEVVFPFPWFGELPPDAITDTAQLVGSRARYAIQRGQPVFSSMVISDLRFLPSFGSDAALQIPPGFVAVSMPYDKRNGVALAVRDGDSVNVMVSWAIVDIDQQFQSALPNLSAQVQAPSARPDGSPIALDPDGRPIQASGSVVASVTNGTTGRPLSQEGLSLYVVPNETQRGRLVSQAIIQNARVLRIGQFQDIQPVLSTATVPPPAQAAPAAGEGTPQPTVAPPTATPEPDIITLIVSPQDALVIDYINRLREIYPGAVKITYALRPPGDTNTVATESVTLQYMFTRYAISLPAKLDYGLDKNAPPPTPAPLVP